MFASQGFFHLRRLKCLRKIIPSDCLETLIHAFVSSLIDFCNILLNDYTDHIQNLFQSVQNACAKVITGARRFDSAREQLATLNWLPIKQRCIYKALLFCHRLAHAELNFPSYFSNVHLKCRLSGPLLDSDYKPRLATVGYRSFDSYATVLWNSLPLDIRVIANMNTFKKRLKTHLFIEHYSNN